jgi:hypothetical protein
MLINKKRGKKLGYRSTSKGGKALTGCVTGKARRLFPSLSGEMPTISPFYEHTLCFEIVISIKKRIF